MQLMDQEDIIPVNANYPQQDSINAADYQRLYQQSIAEPEVFWRKQAQRIDWIKPFTQVKDCSFAKQDLHIRWFADGSLNASVNCLDRHLADKGDQTALIWEPDEEGQPNRRYSYRELHAAVCQLANGLKSLGVKKRCRHYLPADDSRNDHQHAGLRPDWRHSFSGVCRIFTGGTGWSN
jgi:acetyl-CoA synthetase